MRNHFKAACLMSFGFAAHTNFVAKTGLSTFLDTLLEGDTGTIDRIGYSYHCRASRYYWVYSQI